MYICTWFDNKLNRFKIDNVERHEKVGDLKIFILKAVERKSQNLVFTYCGCILNDEKYLTDYDIGENSEIHIIEDISSAPSPDSTKTIPISEEDVENVVSSFQLLTQNPGFRSNVQRVVRSGELSKLQKTVPEIQEDTTASSILLDPELLFHLSDADFVKSLVEKHPSLIKAAIILAEHLHDQSNAIHQQPTTSTGYSYSLDALSDDEDMDSNTESFRESNSLTRNSSFNAITSAQLAAAIANATNTAFNTTTAGIPTSPDSNPTIITNEMFSTALQQAFGTITGQTQVSPENQEDANLNGLAARYENELRQMQELGLTNERVNLRALQATSGNIQEAIELILNAVVE